MTCDDLVARAEQVAAELEGVKVTVVRGEELNRRGFGGECF